MKYTRQAYQMMANQPRISLGGKTTPSGGLVTSSGKFDVAVAFPFTVDGAIFFSFAGPVFCRLQDTTKVRANTYEASTSMKSAPDGSFDAALR